MFRQFPCQSYHYDVDQIQISLPLIGTDHILFGKVDMAHGILIHIHAYPDRIHTLDVIVAGILKIPFLLGRDQSADIENCPV